MALREKPGAVAGAGAPAWSWPGFLGVFVCSRRVLSPVFTTSANQPFLDHGAPRRLVVLLFYVCYRARKPYHRSQIIGMLLSLAGAGVRRHQGRGTMVEASAIGDLLGCPRCWAGPDTPDAKPRRRRRQLLARSACSPRSARCSRCRWRSMKFVDAIGRVHRACHAGLFVRGFGPGPFCLFGLRLSRREFGRGVDFAEPLSRADRQCGAVDPFSARRRPQST